MPPTSSRRGIRGPWSCLPLRRGAVYPALGGGLADEDRSFHLLLAERLGKRPYGRPFAAFGDIPTTAARTLGVVAQRDLQESAAAHERMMDAALAG